MCRIGARCVSSTSFGLKGAPETKCSEKIPGTPQLGRHPSPRRAAPRIRKGRVLLIFWSFITINDTPEGAPRGGKLRPKWWGPLNILPQISTIFVHYLIPKVSPGTISYQKNLSKTKKKVFSRTVPFRALYHPLLL